MSIAPAGVSEIKPTWYVATPEGKQEGPLTTLLVRERIQTGALQPGQLVWKDGMANWTPARDVEELFPPAAPISSPAPAFVAGPAPAAAPAPQKAAPESAAPASQFATAPLASAPTRTSAPVEQLLAEMSSPKFFKNMGRVCGALGVVLMLASTVLYFFGFAWFTGALVLCLMWMVGEGTAAILHSLERLGTMVSQKP